MKDWCPWCKRFLFLGPFGLCRECYDKSHYAEVEPFNRFGEVVK